MTLLIFGGTSEGRRLAEALAARATVYVSCATDYGAALVPAAARALQGRRSAGEMAALIRELDVGYVADATHPYATAVSENIRAACRATDTPYLRVSRGEADADSAARCSVARDAAEAAAILRETAGNILLTTGSKELPVFASLPDFCTRVYARVLPMAASIQRCMDCGLSGSRILAMQGPFSARLNAAILKEYDIRILVSKQSGAAGGFPEKAQACGETGTRLLVIGRPPQEAGVSLEEASVSLQETLELLLEHVCGGDDRV